jgi:bifunctional polynucleotide phosphatase/kinase
MDTLNNLIYKINISPEKTKIAGFDLDSTLIKTKSGRVHAKDRDDWQFFSDGVVEKLIELSENGYNIVIFTNQSGLGQKEEKRKNFMYKLNNILFQIGGNVPVSYFISTGYDQFRKPMVGCFSLLTIELKNIDFEKSFYCGDACGRSAGWSWGGGIKKKKDFSSSDLFFAKNCGLNFHTPEEMFLGATQTDGITHEKREFLDYLGEEPVKFYLNLDLQKKYIIVMMGLPASGKSFLSKWLRDQNKEFDFKIVNQDTLKTKSKNNKYFKQLVEDGENIIVDNTNLVPKDRAFYFHDNYQIIGIKIETDWNIIVQLNHFRCFKTGKFIKSIVYNTMKKRMDLRSVEDEGFDKIVSYKCLPRFDNKDDERVFKMYY